MTRFNADTILITITIVRFAGLVIDGSIAYPFNDGAKALLEVHPEDSLLTISISSDEEPNKTETTCA